MNHGSLFSGIGGFDLASEWMGWKNIFQVEIDEFCSKILAKHFPDTQRFTDIKKFDGTIFKGRIDVLSGGFPCQPFSQAGKRKGKDDDRFLWHEMLRAIREIQPAWVVAENVSGLLTLQNGMVFQQVCSEMEEAGYEVQPFIIPACAVDAPHRRDRIWIIAHSKSSPRIYENKNERQNTQAIQEKRFNGNPKSEPSLLGGTDGIPDWMDRIKSLGNAIVPQVAYEIFKAIEQTKEEKT